MDSGSRDYDIERILSSTIPLVVDLTYNSVLVRANQLLEEMAKEIKLELPHDLQISMGKAGGALQTLQAGSGEFFSRNFRTRQLIQQPSVATLYEYFSPLEGKGAGSKPFSWTAALAIDMLQTK